MRRFFENPEMVISMFETESIEVTTTSGDLNKVNDQITQGDIKLQGMSTEGVTPAARQIFAFSE